MIKYKDLNGNSGVTAYDDRIDSIVVRFNDGAEYLYNTVKPGARHISQMKHLAKSGKGLSTYISQFVRSNYYRKLK